MSVLIQLAKDPGEFQLLSAFCNSPPPRLFRQLECISAFLASDGDRIRFLWRTSATVEWRTKTCTLQLWMWRTKIIYILSPPEDIVCGEHVASSAGDSCISIRGCRCPHAYDLAFADGSWSRAGITCIRPHKDRILRMLCWR